MENLQDRESQNFSYRIQVSEKKLQYEHNRKILGVHDPF